MVGPRAAILGLALALTLPCFACTADDAGALLLGEPTVVHHPKQPMVVDLIVELDAPGTGELAHGSDRLVAAVLLDPAPGEFASTLHFRVRGLLPNATHPLTLTVEAADGQRSASWTGEVSTNEALPGFIAKFEIDTPDPARVDQDLRLFDMTRLFADEPSGVFLVDTEGTTRWYVGEDNGVTAISDIWSGLALRPDGSISYVRRDAAFIMDELGERHMEVSAASIGQPTGFHHDLTELPNGNFLVLGYAFREVDYGDEGTLYVAGDMIYEITPGGDLVWSWDCFDHLDPQRRRPVFFAEALIIPDPVTGKGGYDWTHGNGLIHSAADDMILLSLRHQDWILAIDHRTGELLWRLGDEGDFTLIDDQYWFFHQHSPQWQADGSLLLYDNAVGNPERPDEQAHSRAVRYELDYAAMTATMVWADDDEPFVSAVAGDADRTSGGHVLRLDSAWIDADNPVFASRLHELDPGRSPNLIWSLKIPPLRFSYRALPVSRWVGEPAP